MRPIPDSHIVQDRSSRVVLSVAHHCFFSLELAAFSSKFGVGGGFSIVEARHERVFGEWAKKKGFSESSIAAGCLSILCFGQWGSHHDNPPASGTRKSSRFRSSGIDDRSDCQLQLFISRSHIACDVAGFGLLRYDLSSSGLRTCSSMYCSE